MNLKHILMIAQRNNSAFNCKPNEFHRKINIYSINAFQMKSFSKKSFFVIKVITHLPYAMPNPTNLYHKFGILFTGFTIYTKYVENTKVLQYSGYRFHKNRVRKSCTHYVCSGHNRFKCRAKVCTKWVNGYEMMKVKYDVHTHAPDESLLI